MQDFGAQVTINFHVGIDEYTIYSCQTRVVSVDAIALCATQPYNTHCRTYMHQLLTRAQGDTKYAYNGETCATKRL